MLRFPVGTASDTIQSAGRTAAVQLQDASFSSGLLKPLPTGGVAGITEQQRIPQTWVVGDVDQCVAQLSTFIEEYGLTDIVSWAVPPGLRPDDMSASLERYARDVAPCLRARFGGSP